MASGFVCTHTIPRPPMAPLAQVKATVNNGAGVLCADTVGDGVSVASSAVGDATTFNARPPVGVPWPVGDDCEGRIARSADKTKQRGKDDGTKNCRQSHC